MQSAELKSGSQGTQAGVLIHHSSFIIHHFIIAALLAAMVSGCATTAKAPPTRPGGKPPANLDSIPDAVPRVEPINPGTARPYVVMGRS